MRPIIAMCILDSYLKRKMKVLTIVVYAIVLILATVSMCQADNSARINEISSECFQLMVRKQQAEDMIKQYDRGIRERTVVINELRRLDSEAEKLAKIKRAEAKAKEKEKVMPKDTGNHPKLPKGQVVRDGGGNKKNAGNDALITENSKSVGPAGGLPTAKKEDRTATPLGQDVR